MTCAPTTSSDFDWQAEADSVVLQEQPRTAVYQNRDGSIVVRQERAWDADDDSFVLIVPENAVALAEAIAALGRELIRDGAGRAGRRGDADVGVAAVDQHADALAHTVPQRLTLTENERPPRATNGRQLEFTAA